MTSNQECTQETDIQDFKERFLKDYGVNIHILTDVQSEYKMSLENITQCSINALKNNESQCKHIDSFSLRSRARPYLFYVQAMSYIAYREGYTKTAIGLYINRDHATIINSVKQMENAFFTKDKMMLKAFNNILNEIHDYVGNLSENIKKQIDSKPNVSSVWNEAKNSNSF